MDDKIGFVQAAPIFCKYGLPVLCIAAIGLFLKIHFRADLVPDYLSSRGSFFNRGGFCFQVYPTVADGRCVFMIWFQNQYEKPLVGRIALRPARGFFLGRPKMDPILVEIDSPPAAYGMARVAVPLPVDLQGRNQSFEVGASVEYPEGKGRQLRFRDGITLRTNSNFGSAFTKGLMVAGALTGQIVYESPATVSLPLPKDVAEEIAIQDKLPSMETLWKLGDPPLTESKSNLPV